MLLALAFILAGGFADPGNLSKRTRVADSQMRAVENLARSSVSGSVPGRDSARHAQAAAIREAQRMGIDLSVASVGTGGRQGGNAGGDETAFARVAVRLPDALRAAVGAGALRHRFQKTWTSTSQSLVDGRGPNGSSQIITDARGRTGACVVELRATDSSLRAVLSMAYDDSDIGVLEFKAQSLDISASDVAFFVSAHESAHCVISLARTAGLLDESWVERDRAAPTAWGEALSEDNGDNPVLAKAEESAADLLAVFWAADVLGPQKARQLARLVIHARAWGARPGADDGLHDSSLALAGVLALSDSERFFPVASAARVAWRTAALVTRREIAGRTAP